MENSKKTSFASKHPHATDFLKLVAAVFVAGLLIQAFNTHVAPSLSKLTASATV